VTYHWDTVKSVVDLRNVFTLINMTELKKNLNLKLTSMESAANQKHRRKNLHNFGYRQLLLALLSHKPLAHDDISIK
jgi:hypothetical protein